MSDKLDELQKKYFALFDELHEATPSLTGEAYTVFAADLLAKYKIERDLLSLRERIETEKELDELQAKYARVVPQRWRFLRFLWKKKNYAATLNDASADEFAAREFAAIEARLLAEMRARGVADSAADDAGDVSAAPMSDEDIAAEPSEDGATLEEIEAKIAQEAWEKVAGNITSEESAEESADPKNAESGENGDVAEITENGDK